MVYLLDYFNNVWERMKFGKWSLLMLPVLFSIIGIYISISTLDRNHIPFKSFAVENVLMPLVFFVIGFLVPVSMWRRYAIRFSQGQKILWNKDGFSFAFLLLLFAMFLQIFAIWGDGSWEKIGPAMDGNAITQMRRQLSVFSRPFQVGEFVKIFLMIFTAKLMVDMKINGQMRLCREFFGFPLLAFISVGFFTFLMPNYSMMIIYMLLIFFMLFLQEMSIKPRIVMIAALVIPAVIMYSIANLDKGSSIAGIHGINRIWSFFNEGGTGNEQQNEALQAMADGGIIGKGLDRGTIKYRLFGARNDFAYSVLGEELGMWLMLPITLAMAGFLFACFLIAAKINAKDRDSMFAQNIAWGIAIIFTMNILFHIGVNLRLLPNTGQPLPFVSSGGANLAMNFFLLGMLVQLSSLTGDKTK
ncbi:MAG: FtsW/RodA/SpoVE family cell cycle protein [Fibromonadales bacterium]|nr:FtsW/RodA/SpoVE family cell cycle protein [Fibromonadales bacterium]